MNTYKNKKINGDEMKYRTEYDSNEQGNSKDCAYILNNPYVYNGCEGCFGSEESVKEDETFCDYKLEINNKMIKIKMLM